MSSKPEYLVSFGPDAWTIDYEDVSGKITFAFDCDAEEIKATGHTKKLFLSKDVPMKGSDVIETRTDADRARLAVMLSRVREYLLSLGYEVEVV